MNQYDVIVKSIVPNVQEQTIFHKVKELLASDDLKSPWSSSDRYYMKFTKANSDGVSLKSAPRNKLLMVVTESLGTLYSNNRGSSISRGSVLIKLEDNLVYCVEASSWFAHHSGQPVTFSVNGYFEVIDNQTYGKVKELSNINY